MIGEKIRKFEIQSELGAGGYGAVYKAHDSELHRDVAIKVILPQYADNPDFKQRFASEAQTVAQLESPRIVPLYEYWQDENGAFLVMRLIRGGSLRRIMAKQGALSLSQVVRILSDIGEALAVAHENAVVHRDLKPENILIDERGNAYLTDFGIAKHTTEADNITEADAIVGTWAYLSPEQVQNIEVSAQSDIYAFGILLYELLAGKHPFHGLPATMMIMKHLQEHLPDIRDERPDLPHELDNIIQRATAKAPEDRYADTLSLISDLKAVANVSNKVTAPVTVAPRKQATSPEERYHQAMLQNVRKFWIHSVLENSAENSILLNLGKRNASHQISNPWETVVRTTNGAEQTMNTDATILDIFEQMNGKLLILGEPGGGKTTMLLELARELLNQADYDDAHPIPVVFNLSSWAEKQLPLEEWLVHELSDKYQVPKKVSSKWVENDELLLLLDGLDEVQAKARDACVKAINAFRTEHGFVDMVVCSRIHDYEDLSDQLLLNGAIVIQPLTNEQIQMYLQQFGPMSGMASHLIASDSELAELARSPLMLNIIVQAYRDVSTETLPEAQTVEDRRQQVFKLYVDNVLKNRHFKDYTPEQSRHFLSQIADVMQRKNMTIFQVAKMEQDWFLSQRDTHLVEALVGSTTLATIVVPIMLATFSIGVATGVAWGWLFIAFIFEFVSFIIAAIVAQYRKVNFTFVGLGTGGIMGLLILISFYTTLTSAQILFLVIAIMLYASMGLRLLIQFFTAIDQGATSPTKYQIHRHNMDWRVGLQSALMISGVIGMLIVFSSATASWLVISLGIVGGGISYAFLQYIYSGVRPVQDDNFYTYGQLLRVQAKIALGFGAFKFASMAIILFIIALLFGISTRDALLIAFGFGVTTSIWTSFITGAGGIVTMLVGFPFIARRGNIPRDVYGFLDYARQSVLLRQVGKGYIFIHRYLLEYFADLETDSSSGN